MIYGYVRVSHRDSAASGLSVDNQKQAIRDYCRKYLGGEPKFFIELAESAWSKGIYERPRGLEMCRKMKEGDHVVFFRLDRGFRSLMDFTKTVPAWVDKGINVHFMDQKFDLTTANGKLFAHIAAAYAQWKSDMISERTRLAIARKRAGGSKPKSKKTPWEPSIFVREPAKEEAANVGRGTFYSYSRVSHVESLGGYSLEAQRAAIDGYCEAFGYPQTKHFEDHAVSAFTCDLRDRPSGRLLDEALQDGDHVVFPRLDRVWRSTLDMAKTWEDWKQRGITVHFADTRMDTSTAAGQAFVEMLAVFARWESADTSERIRGALKRMAELGGPPSSMPYYLTTKVYQGKRRVVPDIDGIRDGWHILLMRKHGMTMKQIAERMEEIHADREGRRPIPVTGIDRRCLSRFIPQHLRKKYRPTGPKGLVHPQWTARSVELAVQNAEEQLLPVLKRLNDSVRRPHSPSPRQSRVEDILGLSSS